MTLDLEIGGRTRRVNVRRQGAGAGWIVTVDGRELFVDFTASNSRWSLLIRNDSAEAGPHPEWRSHPEASASLGAGRDNGPAGGVNACTSYEIAVDTVDAGDRVVFVNGFAVPVAIAGPRTLFGRRVHEASSGAGPARVAAPMPGRVVKVLVRVGDVVTAGQALVVIEAMKMENELRAPRAATVTEVRVAEGTSVEANMVMVVLE